MQLEWTTVESSNINALAMSQGNLYVRFHNGGVYEYSGVPDTIFDELVSAESVGGTFHKLIRSNPEAFPYRKLSLESG